MTFDLHLCCNDEHTGQPLGACDGVALYAPGDPTPLLSLSTLGQGTPWVSRFDGEYVVLGCLRLWCWDRRYHVGNLCYDAVYMRLPDVARLLHTLQPSPSWAYEEGTEPVSEAWLGSMLETSQWAQILTETLAVQKGTL